MSDECPIWLERLASIFNRGKSFFRVTALVVVSILTLVGCLIFVDVIMRYIFNAPIRGVSVVTGLALVLAVFLTIPYAQQEKTHVRIDMLVRKLSPKGTVVLNNILYCLAIGAVALLAWQGFAYTLYCKESNLIMSLLSIPVFPFAALIPLCSIMLIFLLVRDFLNNLVEGVKLHLGSRLWLLSFGVLLLMIAGMIFWIHSSPLEVYRPLFGVIALLGTVLFFMTGMPLGYALLLASFLLLASIKGLDASFMTLGNTPYRIVNTDTWAVVALFILMGYLVFTAGFGRDLYHSAYKWLGRLPGGLAQATIGASAAFAGVIGDAISGAVTFGAIALPEMRRYKYSESLSAGTICAGATLGPMIPPSLTFIIYGLLTNQPIGVLFIAGVVPGLLLAAAFMIYIHFVCLRNPSLGPRGPSTSFIEKLASLKLVWPVAVLFILVIGGMYAKIFTPNEGAGIGLAGTLIIGLAMRRFNRQNLTFGILEAAKTLGMIFLLIIGSLIFGYFIAGSEVQVIFAQLLGGGNLPPTVSIIIICVIYLILGMLMDPVAIMMITIPIFYPIAMSLGYDPIWFGIIIALLANVACITPPYAVTCFAFTSSTGMPISTVYRGVIPFCVVTLVITVLLIAFPQIPVFLPNLLR
jgi:tripartite ATP-independent transporter DctM subunit